jgi:RNA polymerase sigma factor, sigma-70 family
MSNTTNSFNERIRRTNEEMAIGYQAGDKSALNTLYEQNRGVLTLYTNRLQRDYEKVCESCGILWEDINQELYFAVEKAARAYKPESGYKYTTFLYHHARVVFQGMAGQRTDRQKAEPLSNSYSLNVCAGEDMDLEQINLVPDPQAELDFDSAEDSVYTEQLHNAFERALNRLNPQQKHVIKGRFYQGKTLAAVGQDLGVSADRVRQLEAKALREFRHGENLRELREFRIDPPKVDAYSHVGFSAWESSGSIEERIAEMRKNR